MKKRFLSLLLIVCLIFCSVSTISAMDNEGLDSIAEFISQDANSSCELPNSDVNNKTIMENTNNGVSNSALQDVNKSTKLDSPNIVKYFRNGTDFTATLVDSNGKGIANQAVTFDIVGVKAYTRNTNENGVASLIINLNVGFYTVNVIFNGTSSYDSSSSTGNIEVLSTVVGGDLTKYYRNGSQYSVTLMGYDKPLANTRVSFSIVGKTYYATTNSNGVATLTINLIPGTYTIVTKNLADNCYRTDVIKVLSTLTTADFTKGYLDSHQFTATVVDGTGSPSAGSKVSFTFNFKSASKTYTATTNDKGVATLAINLAKGSYNVVTTDLKSGLKYSNTIKVLTGLSTNIKAPVTTINEKSGEKVNATIYDSLGYGIPNMKITLTVGGNTYTANTDANGVAFFALNLNEGVYDATYKFSGTNFYKSSSLKSTINVISGDDVIFVVNDTIVKKGTSFNITVKDINGTPISNLHLYFTVNGVKYNAVTNNNGIAGVIVNENPAMIPISYTVNEEGYAKKTGTSNVMVVSTFKPTLSTNNTGVIYTGQYFYLKLSVDNIPLSNQQVSITINGQEYPLKTNSEGWACLQINLYEGNYSFICNFNGTSDFENASVTFPVTVIKSTGTILTYLGGTEYVKGQDQFTVLLTDQNANVLANQKVTITVISSTYSVSYPKTTDGEGLASLAINLNPGEYTIKYRFDGSGQYGASEGSDKIKVVLQPTSGFGYWLRGSDMESVNLATLANKGTSVIFLNYYALEKYGQKTVENWIQKANSYGIKVHIWMQAFYDGDFILPVLSDGTPNYSLFNDKVSEAKYYASIKGVSGIHLDYLRFKGNAYKYTGGTEAINIFVKMCVEAVHSVNPNIIVSGALMPETSSNVYYYGQDIKVLGEYLDVVIPMIYKGNYGKPTSWIKTTTQWFVENSPKAQVWSGLQSYKSDSDTTLLSISELTADANAAMDGSAKGVILFRYGLSNLLDFNTIDGGSTPYVPSGTTFTKSEIQQGAKYIKEYMESNGVLPNSITVNNKVCSAPQFLYLMSLYVYNYNTKDTFSVIDASNPTLPSGDEIRAKFNKNDFIKTAGDIVKYMETYNRAPNYAETSVGKTMYSTLVYSYAKIVNYDSISKALPSFVYVTNIVDDYSLTVVMYPSAPTPDYKYIKYRTTWLSYCPYCGYYGTLLDNPKHTDEGELTCSYCDCDYCGVTGKIKDTTSNLRITNLTAPVPESDINPDNVSLSDIIKAADYVKGYYEANGEIPSDISLGDGIVSSAQFLYLLSVAIGNIEASNSSVIDVIDVKDSQNPTGDEISSTLSKTQYTELANRVAKFIIDNGQAPNYATSDIGKIAYDELVDSFSRIVSYYGNNNKLPNTVAIKWSSGGSSLVYKLAISLTEGLTSETDKATALYNYVRDYISYEFYYNTKKGAEGTLISKAGNCCDQAQLLVALGRDVGLTCRFVHGECTFTSGLRTGHVWVQFQINGNWINADPTSSKNSFGVIKNWDTSTFTLKGYYDVLPF